MAVGLQGVALPVLWKFLCNPGLFIWLCVCNVGWQHFLPSTSCSAQSNDLNGNRQRRKRSFLMDFLWDSSAAVHVGEPVHYNRDSSVPQSASLEICLSLRRFSSVLAGARRCKFLSLQTVPGPFNLYPMQLSAARELFILICSRSWGRLRKEKILVHRKNKATSTKSQGWKGNHLIY